MGHVVAKRKGRPTKSEPRNISVAICLSERESRAIYDAARRDRQSVSTWLRQRLRRADVPLSESN